MKTEKKIEDYLHLYLGCECLIENDNRPVKITGMINTHNGTWITWVKHGLPNEGHFIPSDRIKPILRPISDMTKEEMEELFWLENSMMKEMEGELRLYIDNSRPRFGIRTNVTKDGKPYMSGTLSMRNFNPYQFQYLLSKLFDLFGLIEAGLAIDSTNQNPNL